MYFIYVLTPNKVNFLETMNDEDSSIISEHADYLKRLLDQGKLIIAGPTLNAKFGIAVFEADSEEEAQSIMKNDPAVKKNVMSAELNPFSVSFLRK